MRVENFAEIETEFIERVHSIVWCSVATIDSRQRPRSRILHPIWEGATGWIGTHRNSHKSSIWRTIHTCHWLTSITITS